MKFGLSVRFALAVAGTSLITLLIWSVWHIVWLEVGLEELAEHWYVFAAFVLSMVLPVWFALRRWVLGPVRTITGADSRVAADELSAALISESVMPASELGEMMRGRNSMLASLAEQRSRLQESEERLRFAMEASGFGYWDWNTQTNGCYFSAGWTGMLGYAQDEVAPTFQGFADLIHPEDLPDVQEKLEAYFSDRSDGFAPQFRMRCKNDTWKWIQARGEVVERDASRAPLRMLGTHIDITMQREAEASLKAGNAFLNHVLESMTHPFVVINAADHTITLANAAARAAGAVGATTCHALTHSEQTPCNSKEHPCPLSVVLETGKPTVVNHVHYDSVGQPRHMEVHGYPLLDDQGSVVHMIEYSLDITDRVEQEQQLKTQLSEQRAMEWINQAVQNLRKPEDLRRVVQVIYDALENVGLDFQLLSIHQCLEEASATFATYLVSPGGSLEEIQGVRPNVLRLWKAGRAVYRSDLQVDAGGLTEEGMAELEKLARSPVRSILDVPHGSGTLALASAQPEAFSEKDIRLVQRVASVLSVGIGRAEDLERLEAANQRLKEKGAELTERMKELNCLYGIARIVEGAGQSLDEILQRTVDLIPAAWQFPEATSAAILVGESEYHSEGYADSPDSQAADIKARGRKVGEVRVAVSGDVVTGGNPFLEQERELLGAIGERLGRIVERVRAAEALQDSEERQKAITASAQDAIVMIDNGGMVSFWNEAAERIFGYAGEEIIGKDLHQILVPERFMEAHHAAFPRFQASGEGAALGKTLELAAIRKNGQEFPVELSLAAVELQGVWQAVGIMRDITERQQTQKEMVLAKEAAEAASKAKSEFLANMSHEIRTPMNGIMGMTELALDTDLTDDQREFLTAVQSSADSLLTIINDILDFSKIEAGKLELDPVPFRLRDAVGQTLKALAFRAAQKNLELTCEILPEVPENVIGDAGRLNQVLINLVGNAIKCTEHGEIGVRVTHAGSTEEGAQLQFSVSDSGIGIPEAKQALIFEAFSQADGSTTRRFGGTGLGLTISTQLVSAMGGRIWVESPRSNAEGGMRPPSLQLRRTGNAEGGGPGSTFHFTAVLGVHDAAASEAPDVVEDLGGYRALIVDDNQTNRRILQQLLAGWKVDSQSVAGGEEALEVLCGPDGNEGRIDVVLTDVHMPGMDGYELVKALRSEEAGREVPIVVLTSGERTGDGQTREDLGVDGFLIKPVVPSELKVLLGRVLADAESGPSEEAKTDGATGDAGPELKILLAEDNPINQKVAVRTLERDGHRVTVAGDGCEALEELEKGDYDVILMDIQMPRMDGFATTTEIRRREAEAGSVSHVPILAMTAHAMQGDRERCLEAGMDGYVSKPVKHEALVEAIAALTLSPAEANDAVTGPPAPASAAGPAFDPAGALDQAGDDREFLCELIGMYTEQATAQIQQLRQALADGDAETLMRTAHTIKGAVGNFQAKPAADAAFAVEMIGRESRLPDAPAAVEALEAEMNRLGAELMAFAEEA
jgi:PAS domain S-box-containing protein